MEARFKVRQDLAYWASDCGNFTPGITHVVNGTAIDMQTVMDAAQAGVLVDIEWDDEAKDVIVYESEMESQKKLAEAMESGEWHKGHLEQFGIDAESGGLIAIGEGE